MDDFQKGYSGESMHTASTASGVLRNLQGAAVRAAEISRSTPSYSGGGTGFNSPLLALVVLGGLFGLLCFNFGVRNVVGWGLFGIELLVRGIIHIFS